MIKTQTKRLYRPLKRCLSVLLVTTFVLAPAAFAAPSLAPGDMALRHDIQVLADYGLITGPVTSWPLSWDSLAAELKAIDDAKKRPAATELPLQRLRARAERNTRRGESHLNARLGAAEKPSAIRSFQNTPREEAELTAGFTWLSDRFSINLNATAVDAPVDDQDLRADGSEIGLSLGNFTIAASTMERWWGPGWDGSLILSNNARPIPALTISRNLTKPFNSQWLSWIGPWDVNLIFGQMEEERFIPNAQFFGMRVTLRPFKSLEIGISRTAQWCGDGRPCGFDTFKDLFFGKDNVGDAGTTPENEPGNQLAGLDFRWSNRWFGTPMAIYGQFTGEDEAGGFPSRYLALGGVEISGWSEQRRWSYRWYAELAGTSCDFLKDDIFNCAYNHGIYQTGYRYRGRAIGHGADNDALIGSLGLIVVTENAHQLRALIRAGDINRAGGLDLRHTLTATPLELLSADLSYSRPIGNSRIDLSIGYEQLENPASSIKTDNTRAYLQWHSGF